MAVTEVAVAGGNIAVWWVWRARLGDMSSTGRPLGRASRATLSEVAGLAGVSISTVSKVLNGRSGVSRETRARVESMLQHRQYNRRKSVQGIAPIIEVLIYEVDSPFAGETLATIERGLREQGVGMVVSGVDEDHLPGAAWVDGVLARHPLGVILVASELRPRDKQRLRARNIPIVVIDPSGTSTADAPSIGSADWRGGILATRHLIDLGHEKIAIITGPDGMLASTARLSGYRAALEDAHIAVWPEFVRPGMFHHQDGVREGRALLRLSPRPTAIFASSDLQALGVYEAARSLDVSIPEQLSVVGYDDLAIARWAGPPMTTIRVPITEMAEHATHLITRLRGEPELALSPIEMATSLVVRESTAPPPE